MKKNYTKPEFSIERIYTEDILTESLLPTDPYAPKTELETATGNIISADPVGNLMVSLLD